MSSLPEHVSGVTAKQPIDGTKQRRAKSAYSQSKHVRTTRVHPGVWAAAQRALRPGEKIVVVDERTVRTVNV